jgi:fluoride exporter
VFQKLFLIALAGSIGTLARYGLSGLIQNLSGGQFPWGTLSVNIIGCYFFGLTWALAEERLLISGEMRMIILIGFMGAFTTFSTYMFESGELLRDSQWLPAIGNLMANNLVGFLFLFLGFRTASLV